MLRPDSLPAAIATTVAYFDVFACAPRAAEIHRFLIGKAATRADVEAVLEDAGALRDVIARREGFYYLRGKPHLVQRRIRFLEHSRQLWPTAWRMGQTVERTGLASAAMVTGSLAADNADEHADIDFLLIYRPNRAWASYAAVRILAKLRPMGLRGFCPNYALPEDRLEIRPQNLFTAFEIAKAVPVFGFDTYQRMILANAWVARLLPNALPMLAAPGPIPPPRVDPLPVRLLAKVPPLSWLEASERRRKFARDTRDVGVDMHARDAGGSVDRHSPTRSFHAMSELRYRLDHLGLSDGPLYDEIAGWTAPLDEEMRRWGSSRLSTSPLVVVPNR